MSRLVWAHHLVVLSSLIVPQSLPVQLNYYQTIDQSVCNRVPSVLLDVSERLLLGEDGSAWYTADHYKTFSRIE